jgi:hypothetical protein
MQVVQIAVVPPRTGKLIFANIGSMRNSSKALMNRVRENSATDIEARRETATTCEVATFAGTSRIRDRL